MNVARESSVQSKLVFCISGLEEEKLYKEAMANDEKISLSYTKILALGPGQVGKSTFLYRLLGLMKGNILTADPKTQPQSSTGVAELREACITYTSRTGALTSESWQVFDKCSDLQCQLNGLMSLLIEQAIQKETRKQAEREPKSTQFSEEQTNPSLSSAGMREEDNEYESHDIGTIPQSHSAATNPKLHTSTSKLKPRKIIPENPSIASSVTSYPLPKVSNIDKVMAEFESIQTACKLTHSATKFRMLFNVADIGGQPAFLEMLPSLTIGPALYLVFMKLLQGLTTRYPVVFKCKEGRGSKLCKNYTYTSEEVIFTALSSIACFGHSDDEVEKYVSNTGNTSQTSSLALLVGTFRDEIKDEGVLAAIDNQLEQQIEETEFYSNGLIYSKTFLHVNNYSAEKSELEYHRKLLEEILKKRFHKYEIPTRWLVLSICLKLLSRTEKRHEVSFEDCAKLGGRLGMKREMVKVALQFLHKYIGLIMYFPTNKCLKNVVICDPQVVFSSISELIFEVYDPRKMYITEAQHDHFVRTGCFSPQDIKLTSVDQFEQNLLSIETLVDLLVHLNIIAEVPSNLDVTQSADSTGVNSSSTKQKRYFFLPAVLQTAELSLLTREESEEQLPEPLCLWFPAGYLPLGFVCALCANLIAESKFKLIPFIDNDQQVTYKNKMKFRFLGKFDIIMVSGPKYCEFHVSRWSGSTSYWDSECCPRIKAVICEAADRVIQSLKHGSLYKPLKDLTYDLAFKCPMHQTPEVGRQPLAKFVYDDSRTAVNYSHPKEIQCVFPTCATTTDLSPSMKIWFGEVRYV